MRGVGLVCFVVVLSACGSDSRGQADAADVPGGDEDPDCHYDCFGYLECSGDRAQRGGHAPIPCEHWNGSCVADEVTCTNGCDLPFLVLAEYIDYAAYDLEIFCAETPAAQVGDPCSGGCLPTRAVADDADAVTQTYLSCDSSSGTCVAAEAPIIDDYLAPCPETAAELSSPGVSGVADGSRDTAPDAGLYAETLCLLAWDEAAQAMRHGVTVHCVGDWECPEGASCDQVAPVPADADLARPVCRPGARGAPLVEHLPARS